MAMNKITNKITCAVCGSSQIGFHLKKNDYNFYRCRACRLIFVWPLPDNPAEIYDQDYFQGSKKKFGYVDYEKDKEAMKNIFLKYLKIIGNYVFSKNSLLLDIGAATGVFVELANSAGFKAEGIEPSFWAAEIAGKKGLKVCQGTIETANFPRRYFDVLTLFDVFEHLKNPQISLQKMNFILKDKGILVINTMDSGSLWANFWSSRWQAMAPPEHLFLYNQENIKNILERNGFKILKIKKINKFFNLSYVFYIASSTLKNNFFGKFSSFFSRHSAINFSIPLIIRDNMLVICRKFPVLK